MPSAFAPPTRDFNPRSPRGGATHAVFNFIQWFPYFNPRSPRGGATTFPHLRRVVIAFQSTLPTRGSDPSSASFPIRFREGFQSTLPTRGSDAGFAFPAFLFRKDFNPRSPRGGATAEKCICIQHFREFAEYYPLRHGDARCIAPQDCIIQAFFGAKKRCFYVRLCFALKNKGVRG